MLPQNVNIMKHLVPLVLEQIPHAAVPGKILQIGAGLGHRFHNWYAF
jgi:hypothetical protein